MEYIKACVYRAVTPHIRGNTRIAIVKKANVLRKDNKAETFPFDKAVNIEEVKIFKPQNIKPIEKSLKPSVARWNTLLLLSANIFTIIDPPKYDIANIPNEVKKINRKQEFNIRFCLPILSLP